MNSEWTPADRLKAVARIARAMEQGPMIPPLVAAHIGEVMLMILSRPASFLINNWTDIERDIKELESLPKTW